MIDLVARTGCSRFTSVLVAGGGPSIDPKRRGAEAMRLLAWCPQMALFSLNGHFSSIFLDEVWRIANPKFLFMVDYGWDQKFPSLRPIWDETIRRFMALPNSWFCCDSNCPTADQIQSEYPGRIVVYQTKKEDRPLDHWDHGYRAEGRTFRKGGTLAVALSAVPEYVTEIFVVGADGLVSGDIRHAVKPGTFSFYAQHGQWVRPIIQGLTAIEGKAVTIWV